VCLGGVVFGEESGQCCGEQCHECGGGEEHGPPAERVGDESRHGACEQDADDDAAGDGADDSAMLGGGAQRCGVGDDHLHHHRRQPHGRAGDEEDDGVRREGDHDEPCSGDQRLGDDQATPVHPIAQRSATLDRLCAEIGRDPAEITRSIVLPASYDRPQDTRHVVRAAIDGGFSHIVLGLPTPYPAEAARRITDTIIDPPRDPK
jgi:hypothetical protein